VTEIDSSGDGTGYSLTIKMHYASRAQKLKDKIKETIKDRKKKLYIFSFNIMDIKTRMYV